MTKDRIREEIEKIRYTYGLNNVIRYSLKREEGYKKSQSVAEHVCNMLFLANYFLDYEDPEKQMDYKKIVQMILMHDMGEIETGDIMMANKTDAHLKEEDEAIKIVRDKSPDFVKKRIEALYEDFENPKSLEAKFVKAIDKIEAQFWFNTLCDVKMIKEVTPLSDRIKNESKRRALWPKLGFRIIESFALELDEIGKERGLYDDGQNFKFSWGV